jgi:GNAT superfamily N-acetyltransferase
MEMDMEIAIEINPAPLDHRSIAKLFGRSGWGRKEEYDGSGVWLTTSDHMLIAVALDDSRRLLGLGRAFTDHATVTWLSELLVDPDYRNRGIGTKLMHAVLRRTGHTAVYADIFPETVGFFEKFKLTSKSKLVAVSRQPMP